MVWIKEALRNSLLSPIFPKTMWPVIIIVMKPQKMACTGTWLYQHSARYSMAINFQGKGNSRPPLW